MDMFGIQNQFTADEVYDNYPSDRFWIDIFTFYLPWLSKTA